MLIYLRKYKAKNNEYNVAEDVDIIDLESLIESAREDKIKDSVLSNKESKEETTQSIIEGDESVTGNTFITNVTIIKVATDESDSADSADSAGFSGFI